jgi:hypothetical protein
VTIASMFGAAKAAAKGGGGMSTVMLDGLGEMLSAMGIQTDFQTLNRGEYAIEFQRLWDAAADGSRETVRIQFRLRGGETIPGVLILPPAPQSNGLPKKLA